MPLRNDNVEWIQNIDLWSLVMVLRKDLCSVIMLLHKDIYSSYTVANFIRFCGLERRNELYLIFSYDRQEGKEDVF